MTRELRDPLIVVAILAVAFASLLLIVNYDLPNVVNCTDVPTISVDVSPNRAGRLVKHEFLGCDWYWWTAWPHGD